MRLGEGLMEELKPCPFCGGIPDIGIFDDEGNRHNEMGYEENPWSGLTYGIVHDDTNTNDEDVDCPIAVADIGYPIGRFLYDSKEEAIEAWNRRASDV